MTHRNEENIRKTSMHQTRVRQETHTKQEHVSKVHIQDYSSENFCAPEVLQWKTTDTQALIGFIAAMTCCAWIFLALLSPAFVGTGVSADSFAASCSRLCFVLGAVASLCCTWLCADIFAKHNVVCYILSVVCGASGLAGCALVGNNFDLSPLFSFLLGAGSGLLYPQIGDFICAHFYAQIKDCVHGLFVGAVAICCPLLFFNSFINFAVATVFVVISYTFYAIAQFVLQKNKKAYVEKQESDARQAVSWRSYFSTATAAIASGYAIGCIVSLWDSLSVLHYIVLIAAVLFTCIILLIDSFHKQLISETIMMRFFLPVSSIAVLPLLLVNDTIKPYCAILLLCWSVVPLSCSIVAMFKHVIICELATLRSFSFGRMVSFLGIFFGMGIAFIGFSNSAISDSPLSHVTSVVIFLLIVIFSTSFVMVEDNFPEEENFHIRNEDGETHVDVDPGTPIRKIDQPLNSSNLEGRVVEEIVVSGDSVFQARCDAVSKTYGLSNRQQEVLAMLARGRNADYITEKLFISPHTTKAHIYNVYQKTGVHSRQELMDLVENTDYDIDTLRQIEDTKSNES